MSYISTKMDAAAQSLLARPLLIKSIQASTLMGIGLLTGVAASLYAWVVPIIRQAKSTRTKTRQFRLTVTKGFQYLQPSSRIVGVALATMTYVLSRSRNPIVASQWKFWAAATAVILPVAPYEIITVFPTNDQMYELDDELQRTGKDNFGDGRDGKVDELLNTWQRWHAGRVVIPLIAGSILAWGATDLLPL